MGRWYCRNDCCPFSGYYFFLSLKVRLLFFCFFFLASCATGSVSDQTNQSIYVCIYSFKGDQYSNQTRFYFLSLSACLALSLSIAFQSSSARLLCITHSRLVLIWPMQNDAEHPEKWLNPWHMGTHLWAIQWIPTRQGLHLFQKSLHLCALDENNRGIGRDKNLASLLCIFMLCSY